MTKITTLSILILFCSSSFAQKEYVQKNKNYTLARIYQKDNKILKVNNLELINDTVIIFKVVGTPQKEELSVSNVKYVSVKKGSKALPFGLMGAGIGLFSVAITHATHSSDPYTEDFNWAPMYVGFTVGCGVIGAFIGAFSYKWKRLYFQNNDLASHIMIFPNFQENTYGIGLTLTF